MKLKAETDKQRELEAAAAAEAERKRAEELQRKHELEQLLQRINDSAAAAQQRVLQKSEAQLNAEREAARAQLAALEKQRDEERRAQLLALEQKLRAEQNEAFNKQLKALNGMLPRSVCFDLLFLFCTRAFACSDHMAALQKALADNKKELERMLSERGSLLNEKSSMAGIIKQVRYFSLLALWIESAQLKVRPFWRFSLKKRTFAPLKRT